MNDHQDLYKQYFRQRFQYYSQFYDRYFASTLAYRDLNQKLKNQRIYLYTQNYNINHKL